MNKLLHIVHQSSDTPTRLVKQGATPLPALLPAACVVRELSVVCDGCRYNFSEFAIKLNEVTPGLEKRLAPTDCRLRPDQHYLELGMYDEVSPLQAAPNAYQRCQAASRKQHDCHYTTQDVEAGRGVLHCSLRRLVQAGLHLHCCQPGSCPAHAERCAARCLWLHVTFEDWDGGRPVTSPAR